MNTATICLGSNAIDAAAHVGRAVAFLSGFVIIESDSGPYPSDPETNPTAPTYTNRILQIRTENTLEELHRNCKTYETDIRNRYIEDGRVTVDIDIVMFNSSILRMQDYNSAYFRKGLQFISAEQHTPLYEDRTP